LCVLNEWSYLTRVFSVGENRLKYLFKNKEYSIDMPDIHREEVTAKSGISKYLNKKAAQLSGLEKIKS